MTPNRSMSDISFHVYFEGSYGTGDKVNLRPSNWGEAAVIPFLRLNLFILYALGAVNLASGQPENKRFRTKKNPWLTVYDGIGEVKITPVGKWLCGKSGDFPAFKQSSLVKISLDSRRLLVRVENSDPATDLTLRRMARDLGGGLYSFTYDSFLEDCSNKRDVEERIRTFRRNICTDPSENWEDFFSSVLSRVDPLEYVAGELLLFKLERDREELIRLLFTDPMLCHLVIKAEDYQVIIRRGNYGAVCRRLAEFGYTLPPAGDLD